MAEAGSCLIGSFQAGVIEGDIDVVQQSNLFAGLGVIDKQVVGAEPTNRVTISRRDPGEQRLRGTPVDVVAHQIDSVAGTGQLTGESFDDAVLVIRATVVNDNVLERSMRLCMYRSDRLFDETFRAKRRGDDRYGHGVTVGPVVPGRRRRRA